MDARPTSCRRDPEQRRALSPGWGELGGEGGAWGCLGQMWGDGGLAPSHSSAHSDDFWVFCDPSEESENCPCPPLEAGAPAAPSPGPPTGACTAGHRPGGECHRSQRKPSTGPPATPSLQRRMFSGCGGLWGRWVCSFSQPCRSSMALVRRDTWTFLPPSMLSAATSDFLHVALVGLLRPRTNIGYSGALPRVLQLFPPFSLPRVSSCTIREALSTSHAGLRFSSLVNRHAF